MKIADRIAAFLFRRRLRGATWFHRAICGRRRIEARTVHGVGLALNPADYVDLLILREGFYEPEVLEAILTRLQAGEVFWDVGANLGEHALTVKKLKPDCAVYAVEPNPEMLALVRGAAARNGLVVLLIAEALDAQPGRARLFVPVGNSGRGSLHDWDKNQPPSIEVATVRGDDLVAAGTSAAPHVIKLDVEGHELQVLRGLANALAGPVLHTVVFEDATDEGSPAKRLLREHGFQIAALRRQGQTQHALENYVATKDRLRS